MNKPHALMSWDELFVQHERFVFRLAYDLVHDRHLAEDLVQQTWLTALERPPTARHSLKGWLATVLRNLAIDHFRTDRRPRAQAHDDLAHPDGTSFADDEEAAAIRQRVLDSLHELDPIYRDVLRLHYIEGQTLAVVAEHLSLPLETARTRCRRGLSRLRGRLDRRYRGRRPWVAALAPLALRAPEAWLAADAGAQAPDAGSMRAPSGSTGKIPGSLLRPRLLVAAAVLVPSIAFVALVLTRAEAPSPQVAAEFVDHRVERPGLAPLVGVRDGSVPRSAPHANEPLADLAAASVGPTKVRVLHAATGEPLAGVRVLMQTESAEVHAESPLRVSDGEGWIALDDLGPGRWTVRPERGKALLVDLPRRDPGSLELHVPDGIEVRGRVVDTNGVVVPFATVHVTWPAWIRAHEVATCDAQGAFTVPRMDRGSLIAGADELGLGWLFGFDSPQHAGLTSITVDLLVPEPGHVVEGRVVDVSGHGVAGASVRGAARMRTTAEAPDLSDRDDVLGVQLPPGDIATTDARGRFRLGHFKGDVEQLRFGAWADGYARGSAAEVEGMVEIRLEREAVIEGRVAAPDGAPAAWARISARVPGQSQPSITRADAQGHFRMGRLPEGRLRFEALSDRSGSEGWVQGDVELRSGRSARWDPQLGEVATIRGVAFDAVGRPLVAWVVQLLAEDEIESHRVTGRLNDNRLIRSTLTDAEGRFAFFGCAPVKHLVKAYPPDDETGGESGAPRAWQWDVVPDAARVELRADASTAARSRVHGTLVMADGAAPGSAEVRLYSRLIGRALIGEVAKGSGVFDVGPLPAGEYRISIWAPPADFQELDTVEVGPGEVVDLGEILVELGQEPELGPQTAGSRR